MPHRALSLSSASVGMAVAALLPLGFAACGGGGTEPSPVPTTVAISPSGGMLTAIDATLQLAATVKDQNGLTMTSATVSWSSSAPAVATVSGSGLVTAVANGAANIQAAAGNASSQVSVTVAQAAKALAKASGDQQTGTTGLALSAPLVAQANDSTGHPVAGVSVTFAVVTGGGSVNPTSAVTNASGQAQTTWTLGSGAGQQSAAATATGLTGSPLSFTATANAPPTPAIATVTPDTLVEGQAATISGTNFSTTASNNVVLIGGTQASVTTASSTSLTVTVPATSCQPARLVNVSVTVGGQTGSKSGVPLHPGGFVALNVGELGLVRDPSSFCLEFRAASSGTETYVVGMSAPAESPGTVMPFEVSATAGMAAAPGLVAATAAPVGGSPVLKLHPNSRRAVAQSGNWRGLETMRERVRAEAALRQWEATNLPLLRAQVRRPRGITPMTSGSITGAAPAPGDTVVVRVPDLTATNPCSTYVTVKTVARVVGSAGIWLYDVQNPTADSLTQADIQNASNQFDTKIFASDTTHFGHPTDLDATGHVFVVLTWQVNKAAANLGGFVFSGDLFPGSSCPQSNAGELYYGEVPDSLNQAATGARKKSTVLANMPSLIAHEFTHIIQFGQRLILNTGQPLESWEAEGQATFAEELVGNAVLGNSSYQNYGASVAFGAAGFNWYSDEIFKWAEYFGDLGANNQAANAPDLCTVYGNIQLTSLPCDVSAFYGASWIFQRYLGDQFGPTYAGGLVQFTRDWVQKNPSLVGGANIQALTGTNYDTLFVLFAAALALDDQDNGTGTAWIPPELRITSWNSDSIATALSTYYQMGWLSPPVMTFGTATGSRSVRGGSTAYILLSGSGARPATSMKFTDPGGAALGTTLRPALWIARIQ